MFGQQITPELQDRIGYLPEERGLYKKMKVGDQIKFFAALKNVSSQRSDSANRSLAGAIEVDGMEKQESERTLERDAAESSVHNAGHP